MEESGDGVIGKPKSHRGDAEARRKAERLTTDLH